MVDPIVPIASYLAGQFVSAEKLYQWIKRAMGSNDQAAADEWRIQLDDAILEEMKRRYGGGWDGVGNDERPTGDDARNASEAYREAYEHSSGPPKRKLLVNAFFGYFNPKFFRAGMNGILWDYAIKLEYPDADYLRKLMIKVDKQMAENGPHSQLTNPANGMRWLSYQYPVSRASVDFEFAKRLASIGLVELGEPPQRNDYATVAPRRDLVKELMEFLWEEPVGTGLPDAATSKEEV